MSSLLQDYSTLGLSPSASKAEVKEAFVKLCLKYHPDKCEPSLRTTAPQQFEKIKAAYDNILKGQAGYAPPPPGTKPSYEFARAYKRAHAEAAEGGPIRCGGPYGGYATEGEFYRALMRTSRNNPFTLILTGLALIPAVGIFVSILNGHTQWIDNFKNEGFNMFGHSYRVNGQRTVNMNPFAIRGLDDIKNSYIYKDEKYAHFRNAADTVSQ
nr:chaperone protein dnaj 8 (DJA8) [Polytomella parva]|mmetsp:Transcript_14089/g.24695  ORF Transcript_14089/g.24695 Transcript_14089/m.24695 type:complete len:212 (-) Transcript_14089:570-1205(-)|eukprot:CAMPEP_0175043074 /NCGR_PEP_ID=MMETSP0052_2-20121109/2957_1 /TAXON_ID=51329 ORGANISM="Polytomella parva, Strain SAG 63-3" /NCGR_SAMPLE_ID=MMETSP0052_2 /ASSEMBLY_ACC=CAM_ASM_000194 /LENGTH=211 /DNA_ID=CAMNT_0016306037 /DNA_START=56 /DNA_END=691 /DNA_ORIENTATION=-